LLGTQREQSQVNWGSRQILEVTVSDKHVISSHSHSRFMPSEF